MRKTYEELCAALEGEEIELNVKLEHLEHFMMSEDFQEISERQKKLLTRQLEAMRMYKGALIARVMQARFEHEQNKGKECEPESEEEERIEPHVFEAMMYEAHRKIKERQKVPRGSETEKEDEKDVTMDDLPECPRCHDGHIPKCCFLITGRCTAPRTECYKNARKQNPEDAEKDHRCHTCYYHKDLPDGPRCKMCDNGSCWEKKETH